MTEDDWLRSCNPHRMLTHLRPWRRHRRKLVLYVCASYRLPSAWKLLNPACRELVSLCEQQWERVVGVKEFTAAKRAVVKLARRERAESGDDGLADVGPWLLQALRLEHLPGWNEVDGQTATFVGTEEEWEEYRRSEEAFNRQQVDLLRDLFGNPFRPLSPDPAWLEWNGGTVPKLARGLSEERELPAGTLDVTRLAVLADALEDAGCQHGTLLCHLRGPGPHVRGCWAVDLILGKG